LNKDPEGRGYFYRGGDVVTLRWGEKDVGGRVFQFHNSTALFNSRTIPKFHRLPRDIKAIT